MPEATLSRLPYDLYQRKVAAQRTVKDLAESRLQEVSNLTMPDLEAQEDRIREQSKTRLERINDLECSEVLRRADESSSSKSGCSGFAGTWKTSLGEMTFTITKMKVLLLRTSMAAALLLVIYFGVTNAVTTPALTRAQAIAIVRSIINRNARPCRISKTKSVTAVAAGRNWRVTARIVMSASGTARNETAVWTVTSSGQATPANQLTAELSNGCP